MKQLNRIIINLVFTFTHNWQAFTDAGTFFGLFGLSVLLLVIFVDFVFGSVL